MATAQIVQSSSIHYNGDIDINSGQLGDFVSINNVVSNISLVPGVNVADLSQYYSFYSITTNAAITVTLPSPSNVQTGWKCVIDLISSTGAGSLTIVDHTASAVAVLSANTTFGQSLCGVEMQLINDILLWRSSYTVPTKGSPTQLLSCTSTGMPIAKPIGIGMYYSACDTIVGAAINVNTLTPTALRWVDPLGKYQDDAYYQTVSDTRIQALVAGFYRATCIVGITTVVPATQANLLIRARVNGGLFVNSETITAANVSPFTDGIYQIECSMPLLVNDYFEIMVNKTIISGGGNPVDLPNTRIIVRYVS
jgi:hypothetical protein